MAFSKNSQSKMHFIHNAKARTNTDIVVAILEGR